MPMNLRAFVWPSLLIGLLVLALIPSNVSAETADYKELIMEEGYYRMHRLTDLLVNKFMRTEEEFASKLFKPERQIRKFKDTKDRDLLNLMAIYSHTGLGEDQTGPEEMKHRRAVYKFVSNIHAIILDAGLSDSEHFSDYVRLFDKLKQLKQLVLAQMKAKNKKHELDEQSAPGLIGITTWGLVYMPEKSLKPEIMALNKPEVHAKEQRSCRAARDRMEIMADFLLNAIEKENVLKKPASFHELVKKAWGESSNSANANKNKQGEEYIGNTLGLMQIYEHLAKDAQYLVEDGDKKLVLNPDNKHGNKLKEKLINLLKGFYLGLLNSYVNNKQLLKLYAKIYGQLLEVREHYEKLMEPEKLHYEDFLTESKMELKEKLENWEKELKSKKWIAWAWQDPNEEKAYAYVSTTWSWIFASDNFYKYAMVQNGAKLEELAGPKAVPYVPEKPEVPEVEEVEEPTVEENGPELGHEQRGEGGAQQQAEEGTGIVAGLVKSGANLMKYSSDFVKDSYTKMGVNRFNPWANHTKDQ